MTHLVEGVAFETDEQDLGKVRNHNEHCRAVGEEGFVFRVEGLG